uniref:(northern house mosquito) hypothetical protein n=1 Tax=Culex pipiens TaxID=7175 RepID=A0A8D8GKW7_CULPI
MLRDVTSDNPEAAFGLESMYSAGGVVCVDVTQLHETTPDDKNRPRAHVASHSCSGRDDLVIIYFLRFFFPFFGVSSFSLLQATELLFFSCFGTFFCFDLFTVATQQKLLLWLCYFFTFFVTLLDLTAIIFFSLPLSLNQIAFTIRHDKKKTF